MPGIEYLVQTYASKVKTLGVFWFVYAGLNMLIGFAGMAFMHAFINHHFNGWDSGPWSHGPFGPEWFGPALLQFAWITVVVRTALAFAAGWGLIEHTNWGRIVALVAAFLSILKFPFGTALGIWTLVLLLGYRNNTLYEQL